MSSGCDGCFQGCTEIVSDQCVKYTGPPISIGSISINTGDPLSEVEEQLTIFLEGVYNGTGIVPDLPSSICDLVKNYLPVSGDISLVDVISALISAACDLQEQVDDVVAELEVLNDDYTIDCLSGVVPSSGTHDILQAVITKLCDLSLDVLALQAAAPSYVTRGTDLNDLIQDYLDSIEVDHYYNKMVPYVAVEYYGPLSGFPTGADGFNANGVGYGYWEQIYLCNGYNGLTPDKRGRIPVGCTNMNGGAFNPAVDPTIPGNPNNYTAPGNVNGANTVTLDISRMPAHVHTATSTPVDPGHRHVFFGDPYAGAHGPYTKKSDLCGGLPSPSTHDATCMANCYTISENEINTKASQTTGISVSTVIQSMGGGQSHNNVPPVMACYYIMYIPTP